MTRAATLEAPPKDTPAALGFTMPGEFEKHAGKFARLLVEIRVDVVDGVFLQHS